MSDQPPQDYPPSEGQVPDPWAAAQQSDFVYRPSEQPGEVPPGPGGSPYQTGPAWDAGEGARWGAVPGSRLDTDPYADKKVGPLHKPETDEVKTGRRLAFGCGAAAVLVAIVGIIVVVLYFRSTTKSGIEAVETGMAVRTKVALEVAVRDQKVNFAENEKFTDDPVELNRVGGQTNYVSGTEVENLEQVAVQLCDAVNGVLIQKKATQSVYFAVFLSSDGGGIPYWAREQQACPEFLDENGNPGEPWSASDSVVTGKEPSTPKSPPNLPSRTPTEEPDPFGTPTGLNPTPTDPFATPYP